MTRLVKHWHGLLGWSRNSRRLRVLRMGLANVSQEEHNSVRYLGLTRLLCLLLSFSEVSQVKISFTLHN